MEDLAKEWDAIVFTSFETTLRKALQIIEPDFEKIAFTGNNGRNGKIEILTSDHPVALNSMGDGIRRILQIVLRIPATQNGILLIDEFENGLHYSVQEKVWKLVFELAQRLNIQVFATTHSWDCIESFAKVAADRKDVEGVLFRVGKSMRASDKGKVIATVFDEEQLYQVTQADVEVR